MREFEDWWVSAVRRVVERVSDEGDLRDALKALAAMMCASNAVVFLKSLEAFCYVTSLWGLDDVNPTLLEVLTWVKRFLEREEDY